jgi:hypothetical protein
MKQEGSLLHTPLGVNDVLAHAEQILSLITQHGVGGLQLGRRGIVVTQVEMTAQVQKLHAEQLSSSDGMLHRSYPTPDNVSGSNGLVRDLYSDEVARRLVEQVCTNALVIYRDLVNTWFPSLASTLGIGCIMPISIHGQLLPAVGSGDRGFVYRMEPEQSGEEPYAQVHLATSRPDVMVNRDALIEEGNRIRRLIAAYHPGAEGWARPRTRNTTWVYGDTPATIQAYQWLWEDLQTLHLVKSQPPSSYTW